MRVIKPGKLGVGAVAKKEKAAIEKPSSGRDIWDDYGVPKEKKKKEYEKGVGNRMMPKAGAPHAKADPNKPGMSWQEGMPESERPQARQDLDILEERLGFSFSDKSLLLRALTHRSALGIKERADYERLEFLGDAVLDLSIAHLLSDRYPDAREGELSKMRAALVNTQALADAARLLDVGPFIRLGRGELSSGGHERPSILADVMEAIVGAMYRDSSYDTAFGVIEKLFEKALQDVTPYDPKTELQEALHAAGSEPPSYLLELVEGPEHAPTFVTVVIVDGEIAGRGRGATKKAAQQAAAAEALGKMSPSTQPLELAAGQDLLIPGALLMPVVKEPGAAAVAQPETPAEKAS